MDNSEKLAQPKPDFINLSTVKDVKFCPIQREIFLFEMNHTYLTTGFTETNDPIPTYNGFGFPPINLKQTDNNDLRH